MRHLALSLTTLLALAAPATAQASSADVIRDCQDGSISGTYSQKEFSDALRNIPTDVDEYTDCRDVIRRAQLGSVGGGGGGGAASGGEATGGGTPGAAPTAPLGTAEEIIARASPEERKAVAEAMSEAGGRTPVTIGGKLVSPSTAGFSPAGAANVLPTPLVVALALLALGLVAGASTTLRSRVLARRRPSA